MDTPDDRTSRLLRPRDVATRLAVTAWTVRKWLADGTLKGTRLPTGGWRIHPSAVAEIEEDALAGILGDEEAA